MTKTDPNQIYIDKRWGLFLGQFNDNILHQHYALQISVVSEGNIELMDENNNKTYYQSCFINSNVKHQFSSDSTALIILINPLSCIGYHLHSRFRNSNISTLNKEFEVLTTYLSNYIHKQLSFEALIRNVGDTLEAFKCECELGSHFTDDRIYRAIQFLEQSFHRVVSLKEVATYSHLSETRFLHLFKEKTSLTFRRYQLWNKLIKSIAHLPKQSITETAHQFGFTDSSHYSRTFKETFGLNPKNLASLK